MSDNNGVPQGKSLYQEMQERERLQKMREEQLAQQNPNPSPQFDVNHQLTNPMLNQ
ncbi:MAG: hypothetical protein K6B14_08160 [Lachnospiraceae bacterium]|nr:hypothetical protein [Lachnospiraceae bacterium]